MYSGEVEAYSGEVEAYSGEPSLDRMYSGELDEIVQWRTEPFGKKYSGEPSFFVFLYSTPSL